MVNIGKLSGVKPGSIVLNNQNLIGKVVEVAKDYSLVQFHVEILNSNSNIE